MDNEIQTKINNAIDRAIEEFQNNEDLIYENEKDRLIFKFSTQEKLNNWEKNKKCIVIGCEKKSIIRSHTIQKSGSIKSVSENGHVYTPVCNESIEIIMSKIGINNASTFPGYCSEHELLFKDFENNKDIKNGNDLALQLYRTVCREIVITENIIKSTSTLIEEYIKFRDKKIFELITEQLEFDFIKKNEISFKNCSVKYEDSKLTASKEMLKNKKKYLNDFLNNFHKAILRDLKSKKFNQIAYKAIDYNKAFPVALAGRGNFHIKSKTKSKNIEVILNVLPIENKTYIFIATLKKHTNELKKYMDCFVNPLEIANMIESWMIHGTDHWFITPSVWENIDSNYKSKIANKILDENYNIGNELEFSIFNNLKLESITLMEKNYKELDNYLIELLEKEKLKLTNI